MNEIEPMEFERRHDLLAWQLYGALLGTVAFPVSVVYFILNVPDMEYLSFAFIAFVASFVGWAFFLWGRKTPCVRITRDEIMVFPNLPRTPKFIQWNSVEKINLKRMGRLEILLADNKKIKIPLSHVDKQDRDDLVRELQQRFEEYKQDLEKAG